MSEIIRKGSEVWKRPFALAGLLFTLAPVPIDLKKYQAVLLDLDGTLYHGGQPLPGAIELIRKLQTDGLTYACLTNSASSPQRAARRLAEMGLNIDPQRIHTAVAAACDYILENFPQKSQHNQVSESVPRVFNLCTESVQQLLDGKVQWVQSEHEPCDVVLAGSPANVYATEPRQRIALVLLRHGAALVSLCADRVYPSSRGLEFGSGALAAMLSYAADVKPIFCGKPERFFFMDMCHNLRLDPARCVLIGDNVESDVLGARSVGMATILTLSGVTRRRDLLKLPPELQPDHVVEDLTELL